MLCIQYRYHACFVQSDITDRLVINLQDVISNLKTAEDEEVQSEVMQAKLLIKDTENIKEV